MTDHRERESPSAERIGVDERLAGLALGIEVARIEDVREDELCLLHAGRIAPSDRSGEPE